MQRVRATLVQATRYGNRKLSNAQAARKAAIQAYRLLMQANRFLPPPRVLLNGHSKSGTHLLSDCLALMPKMVFSGRHFTMEEFALRKEEAWREAFWTSEPRPEIDRERLRRYLGRCPTGMFVTAHARPSPALKATLEELEYRHVLLLRDPRDVAVSHTKFVLSQPGHFQHRFYAEGLANDDDRLMATIEGFSTQRLGGWQRQPSIGETVAGYLGWLEVPSVHVVRFENLVGQRGAGSRESQLHEVRRLGDFVQRPVSQDHLDAITQRMYSEAGLTYRKGVIGDWVNHFTPAHREAFKRVAGDVLIALGYERDTDW